ncbi:MAG TPA: hypothetical protein VFG45_02410 [Candidatus Nitrosocosmicus sp.]|nr:hypothetical protein [Candidatus Nitrosocosmicus sp.]
MIFIFHLSGKAMEVMNLIILIHIILGFILVYFAVRAYKRSRYVPMIFLAIGFTLITIGDTIIGDSLALEDEYFKEMVEEITEISGFVLVIIAVLKS